MIRAEYWTWFLDITRHKYVCIFLVILAKIQHTAALKLMSCFVMSVLI